MALAMWRFALLVVARSQCAAPVVQNQHPNGSCAEGATIANFMLCTPQCAAGYVVSGVTGTLSCFNGQFQPLTFTCAGNPCPVPTNIAFGAEEEGLPNCVENYTSQVPHGTSCTPRCRQGFTPDASNLPWDPELRKIYLPCVAGVLSPPNFTCLGAPCRIPAAGNRPGEVLNANVERPCSLKLNLPEAIIPHQGFCDPLCVQGYHPNVTLIQCYAGQLATMWECLGDPCPAPELIQYSEQMTCREGWEVPHQGVCTPNCRPGYETVGTALSCLAGSLIPPRYDCSPLNCTAHHYIPGALLPVPGFNRTTFSGVSNLPIIEWIPPEPQTCQEGVSIPSGTACTPQCQEGYLPELPELRCAQGSFTPSVYSCLGQPCGAPSGIQDAPPVPCVEGAVIQHGQNCTLRCDDGFLPSLTNLYCNATLLEPWSFSCLGLPCSYPTGIPFAAAQPCLESEANFTHGTLCTTQCQAGYVPSEPTLLCYGAQLRPSSFQCLPNSTYMSYQQGAQIAKAWSKNVANAFLRENFVLACHKDDRSQAMHCASLLTSATKLRQGEGFQVTPEDVEEFILEPIAQNLVVACYRLPGRTACRWLELQGTTLMSGAELNLGTDSYHLALAKLSESSAVLCFQRGQTWSCLILTSTSVGPELALPGMLSGLTLANPTASQVVVCAAAADRVTHCHLLSVSGQNLMMSSSLLLSQGTNFLTAAVLESSVAICFSDWANHSEAYCKLLEVTQSLRDLSSVVVDPGITRYHTMAQVRSDRLLLCFERQGPEGEACVDDRLQCADWAEAGECATNPKYMESLCRLSCGICLAVGRSRLQCNILGVSNGNLSSGPEIVVHRGITWNLAVAKAQNDSAVLCFSDTTDRDAGRCRSVWGVRSWQIMEGISCEGDCLG